jgi:hypothetical protein
VAKQELSVVWGHTYGSDPAPSFPPRRLMGWRQRPGIRGRPPHRRPPSTGDEPRIAEAVPLSSWAPTCAFAHGSAGDTDGGLPIPSVVHQVWLGGAALRWVQLLSLMSVHYVWSPRRHLLHFAPEPRDASALEWRCACAFATCVAASPRERIFGQPLLERAHVADLLRLDLLENEGGACAPCLRTLSS